MLRRKQVEFLMSPLKLACDLVSSTQDQFLEAEDVQNWMIPRNCTANIT